jgi:hypothetical protein
MIEKTLIESGFKKNFNNGKIYSINKAKRFLPLQEERSGSLKATIQYPLPLSGTPGEGHFFAANNSKRSCSPAK